MFYFISPLDLPSKSLFALRHKADVSGHLFLLGVSLLSPGCSLRDAFAP